MDAKTVQAVCAVLGLVFVVLFGVLNLVL